MECKIVNNKSSLDVKVRAPPRLLLTLFYIRGEQIHPRLIKLCAVSRFEVQTTSNLLTTKTNMSFICVSNFRSLTLFYIRGEQIHPRLIKLCAVSRFDVQTTSNLLTAKTNMSFICVSNFRSLN